jgi:hypothetical protein
MYSRTYTKEVSRGLKAAGGFMSVNHETQNRINRSHTYETFDAQPVTSKVAGGAATGTAGDRNVMQLGPTMFEYTILGTQTILAPSLTSVGLDVSMDQTDNDGVEINHGITAKQRHSYIIGTDGPFFFRVKFKIADVSGTDDCAIGFRKVEACRANIDDYLDMAVLNVISGNITIETIDDNAATTVTDTTNDWADGETHTLQVNVSAAGVVTYEIDGAAPVVTAAFTFDNADTVMPFFYFLHSSDVAGLVELIEWECGIGQ